MFQKSIDRRKREGDDRPAPTKTGPRIWDMLCNHFFRLLWANILCVICSLPIVTIPAALSGLFAVVQQYYRKGYGDVNSTFFQEFKQDFLIRIAITLGLVILPVAGWLLGAVFSDIMPKTKLHQAPGIHTHRHSRHTKKIRLKSFKESHVTPPV